MHHGSPLSALVLCASILLSTIYIAPRRIDEVKAAANTPIRIIQVDDTSEYDADEHKVVVERLLTSIATQSTEGDPAERRSSHWPVK